MSDFTIRVRKVLTNPLLNRRQMVVDLYHPDRASINKKEIRTALAEKLKVGDEQTVFLYGFRIAFGGQKSTGFANVYTTLDDAYATEQKYRLLRHELVEPEKPVLRKLRKDAKNKRKRLPGLQKDRGKRKRNRDEDE